MERPVSFTGSRPKGTRFLFPDATVALDVGTNEIRRIVLGDAPAKRRATPGKDVRSQDLLRAFTRRAEVHLVQLAAPFAVSNEPMIWGLPGAKDRSLN